MQIVYQRPCEALLHVSHSTLRKVTCATHSQLTHARSRLTRVAMTLNVSTPVAVCDLADSGAGRVLSMQPTGLSTGTTRQQIQAMQGRFDSLLRRDPVKFFWMVWLRCLAQTPSTAPE